MMLHAARLLMASNTSPRGFQNFLTPGADTFVVPDFVFSISVITVGGSGAGARNDTTLSSNGASGGAGGGVTWCSHIAVTPGQNISLFVGSGGAVPTDPWENGGDGELTWFISNDGNGVRAGGGEGGTTTSQNVGATGGTGDIATSAGTSSGGGDGGDTLGCPNLWAGGGGGIGGYGDNGLTGGRGAGDLSPNGQAGNNGAGGGAGAQTDGGVSSRGGNGGGVGIQGQGNNGNGTNSIDGAGTVSDAGDGSTTIPGFIVVPHSPGGTGGVFDGSGTPDVPSDGAIKVIWGPGRSYPDNAVNI